MYIVTYERYPTNARPTAEFDVIGVFDDESKAYAAITEDMNDQGTDVEEYRVHDSFTLNERKS